VDKRISETLKECCQVTPKHWGENNISKTIKKIKVCAKNTVLSYICIYIFYMYIYIYVYFNSSLISSTTFASQTLYWHGSHWTEVVGSQVAAIVPRQGFNIIWVFFVFYWNRQGELMCSVNTSQEFPMRSLSFLSHSVPACESIADLPWIWEKLKKINCKRNQHFW